MKKSSFQLTKNNTIKQKINSLSSNYLFLSFLLPLIMFIVANLLQNTVIAYRIHNPTYSMLKYDEFHQYYPFFRSFRSAILSGDSLAWNWEIGMGIDQIGLIGYYLGSPLNWLSVIVPEQWLLRYFEFTVLLRISLASLFFTFMLKQLFKKIDASTMLFGVFYATCAWVTGYMWNTIWLDSFALLPLVFLGTIQVLKNRKFGLYTITLWLSITINYYIGFFICIFVLLTCLAYEFCRWEGVKKLFLDFSTMALFSIIAIMMSAFITLPVLAQLSNTSATEDVFPAILDVNKHLIHQETVNTIENISKSIESFFLHNQSPESNSAIYRIVKFSLSVLVGIKYSATNCFVFGQLQDIEYESLPNIYCGIFAVLFTLLMFMNPKISKKEKIFCFLLLTFFNISFISDFLNFVWHGFHFPNSIPYRFSFLYSFVLLLSAYKTWQVKDSFKLWQLFVSFGITVFMLVIHLLISPKDQTFVFGAINITLLLLYFVVLLVSNEKVKVFISNKEQRNNKQSSILKTLSSITLIMVISVELIVNMFSYVFLYQGMDVKDYPLGYDNVKVALKEIDKIDDELFYRIEMSKDQTINDSALIGYNGITTFTSSASAALTNYTKKIGLYADTNRYTFANSLPTTNWFINTKYVIDREDTYSNSQCLTPMFEFDNVRVLKNQYYLPLGFMVDQNFNVPQKLNSHSPFNTQNEIISNAIGESVKIYNQLPSHSYLTSFAGDVKILNEKNDDILQLNCESGDKWYLLSVKHTIEQEGLFVTYYNIPEQTSMECSIIKPDGTSKKLYSQCTTSSLIVAACDVQKGDVVEIVFDLHENKANIETCSAIMDYEELEKAYNILSSSTMTVTDKSNTYIKANVSCQEDGLLYTSIPFNKNWNTYVDGKQVETTSIDDAVISIQLSKGNHIITFEYKNKTFETGVIISLFAMITFFAVVLIDKKIKHKTTPTK